MSVASGPAANVAIGTTDGVLLSDDEGNRWERIPESGLRSLNVLDLAHSPRTGSLFAATERGVFVYLTDEKRWNELTSGLPFTRVTHLSLAESVPEVLYAATPEGIYQIEIDLGPFHPEPKTQFSEDKWIWLTKLFRLEPTVGQIQNQAIRYADVSNWKIKRWQWGSRLRALIPTFSVGKNYSTSTSVDLDRGSTNEPDVYIVGPQDKSQAWDFDLDWNLSDLIWNSAQTSIDSRQKLLVELREDILSEVTRLYFERRRAQTEFVLRPLEDPLDRMNALLRIDELTAHLDALTGGSLTDRLNDLYAENPRLYELWSDSDAA
jgi:hypothetical protein